jgi:tripartite-type tricarboxylate transporter receptor subunit TctC
VGVCPVSRFFQLFILVAATVVTLAGCTRGQTDGSWPAKKISIIVPFKPGGGFDLQARLLAPFLEKYLPNKVNVVIDNVDGASGKMGAVRLARSAPDGYTIGVIGLESVAFMRAMGQLTEDPEQWSWLGQLGSDPLLVAANVRSGLNSPAELKSKDFRFAVTSEILPSAAVLCRTLGAKFRPVHFDGSGDVMLAGMRGDIDAIGFSWPTAIKGVRDSQGKLTSLFVVSKTRVPSIKEVPTLAEFGVDAEAGVYAVTGVSRVMAAPAGLDSKVREILVTAIDQAGHDPEFVRQMKQAEFEVVTSSPDAVRLKVKAAVEEFERAKDTIDASVVGGVSTSVLGR